MNEEATVARILVCLDENNEAEQLEYYQQAVKPDLMQVGHEVHCTTQAEIFDQLVNLRPSFLILIALKRQSPSWDIARCLQSTRGKDYPYVHILMLVSNAPDDSPDNPVYYSLPEYQELYDSYYPGFSFADWIEDFQTFGF